MEPRGEGIFIRHFNRFALLYDTDKAASSIYNMRLREDLILAQTTFYRLDFVPYFTIQEILCGDYIDCLDSRNMTHS